MTSIFGRLLLRVAILAASLAWAGYVFTQTIGDPGRGERVAAAVLADDDARAEVTAPITGAVLGVTGLPEEQRPYVTDQVDLVLRDPAGARTFIDPFAGSWARMLGEDDPRPAELDLVAVLDVLGPTLPEAAGTEPIAAQLPVSGVPLPRVQLDGMSSVRTAISASVVPLTLVAVGAFVAAVLTGERRRVLRRSGVWAVAAGLSWVVVPPVVVWAARRWAPEADAVAAVALDEALSGLLPMAVGLVALGVVGIGASFAVSPTTVSRTAGAPSSTRRRVQGPGGPTVGRTSAMPATATRPMPATRPVASTQEMPQVGRVVAGGSEPVGDAAPRPGDSAEERTVALPSTARSTPDSSSTGSAGEDDRDALWEYYGSS